MMMKNATVFENGDYKKGKSSVIAYQTMTFIRVGIMIEGTSMMASAATIAMRYSTVRRQSPIDPKLPEPRIIDHVTQQMKVFPAIAKVVVFKFAADYLWNAYTQVQAELERGNLTRLPELHALSCCLKAVSSDEVTDTVEVLRRACGGHGYLASAGFSDIYKMVTAAQTYEGENTVLLLQTARYLMKAWQQALNHEVLTPTVEYFMVFADRGTKRENFDGSPGGILRALQSTAAGKVALAFKHVEERKKTMSAEEATNQTGIELTKAAHLHCQVFFLQSAIAAVNKSMRTISPAMGYVLRDLLELYAVDLAFRFMGQLMQVN